MAGTGSGWGQAERSRLALSLSGSVTLGMSQNLSGPVCTST